VNISDRSDDSDELVLNLTPMNDVVFLLLNYFIVATTFLDPEREIDVDLPQAESAGEPDRPPEEIVVNVLEDGTLVVAGQPVAREELLGLLKSAAQHDPETPVTIRGHRLARHETIVGVMDACGLAGLRNLAVGTSHEEG
jgi:biopolymer transport protein ExbD